MNEEIVIVILKCAIVGIAILEVVLTSYGVYLLTKPEK